MATSPQKSPSAPKSPTPKSPPSRKKDDSFLGKLGGTLARRKKAKEGKNKKKEGGKAVDLLPMFLRGAFKKRQGEGREREGEVGGALRCPLTWCKRRLSGCRRACPPGLLGLGVSRLAGSLRLEKHVTVEKCCSPEQIPNCDGLFQLILWPFCTRKRPSRQFTRLFIYSF